MDIFAALKLLGLDYGASKEDVYKRYLNEIKFWHPDGFINDKKRHIRAFSILERGNFTSRSLFSLNL